MARDREMIEPNPGDKRYVRRDDEGKFKEQDDVTRSLPKDQKRSAKTESKKRRATVEIADKRMRVGRPVGRPDVR
jgi:hypothetical protein